MAYTFVAVEPPLIENTTMVRCVEVGNYQITPIEGYALHDKGMDSYYYDPDLMETTDQLILGFRLSTAGVGPNYDWTANPREFYTVLLSQLPENSELFGGVDNDHEVM